MNALSKTLLLCLLLSITACTVSKPKSNLETAQSDSGIFTEDAFYGYTGGWPIGSCRNDLQGSALQVGEVAPQFELKDQYGDTVKLHDFCHMAVLVVTGAAWCGPCQIYKEAAATFYENYYSEGLMVIYLLGENESGGEPAQADLEKWADGYPYAVLADPGWEVTNQGYASGGIPAISLLAPGAEAVIVNGYPTATDIEAVLPGAHNLTPARRGSR